MGRKDHLVLHEVGKDGQRRTANREEYGEFLDPHDTLSRSCGRHAMTRRSSWPNIIGLWPHPGASRLEHLAEKKIRAMHLTQATQFVVAGSWQSIHARCSSFAIGSRTMRPAGTISPGCGGQKGFAARYAARRIIGSRRGACVTVRGAADRLR